MGTLTLLVARMLVTKKLIFFWSWWRMVSRQYFLFSSPLCIVSRSLGSMYIVSLFSIFFISKCNCVRALSNSSTSLAKPSVTALIRWCSCLSSCARTDSVSSGSSIKKLNKPTTIKPIIFASEYTYNTNQTSFIFCIVSKAKLLSVIFLRWSRFYSTHCLKRV